MNVLQAALRVPRHFHPEQLLHLGRPHRGYVLHGDAPVHQTLLDLKPKGQGGGGKESSSSYSSWFREDLDARSRLFSTTFSPRGCGVRFFSSVAAAARRCYCPPSLGSACSKIAVLEDRLTAISVPIVISGFFPPPRDTLRPHPPSYGLNGHHNCTPCTSGLLASPPNVKPLRQTQTYLRIICKG